MSLKSPHIVDWAITSGCNLSCRHCRGMTQGEVSTERARELIEEIAELTPNCVIVEGGEPLLRDDLLELLKPMRQKQLNIYLITNGMLLTSKLITSLASLGIKLMLSIDGDNATTYEAIRGGANFSRVIEQAQNCVREELLETINFTVMKANYTEIPGIFEIAESLGVKQINLIGFKPCHNYNCNNDNGILTPSEYLEAINFACNAARKTGVSFYFDEPFFWPVVKNRGLHAEMPASHSGIVSSSTTACIFGEYIFIEPNGDVKPCSFAPLVMGNINDKCLQAIWSDMLDSPALRQIKDPHNRTGQCGDCPYVTECKGCRSRTFLVRGDWFASDPCCPLSFRQLDKSQDNIR